MRSVDRCRNRSNVSTSRLDHGSLTSLARRIGWEFTAAPRAVRIGWELTDTQSALIGWE
ncbi:hypothetical protein [Streptomyces sp. NPDC005438]|uniref:hypothetical protein n=1 Tax=Streptomyces sp. NPDC005438 TaxID=3156880 RepID=UPI0033B3965B